MSIFIDAAAIANLGQYFDRFPKAAAEAMSLAINDTARGAAMKAARRNILEQVNFPDGYLNREDRLGVQEFSSPTKLQARIRARDRATSLARFAAPGTRVTKKGWNKRGNLGVTVQVKPGRSRRIANGFLYPLRSGNVGFAIRLRPGETLRTVHSFQPVQLFKDVFLLYGPSVNQVFTDVADQITPEVTSEIEREFHRQFSRLTGVI